MIERLRPPTALGARGGRQCPAHQRATEHREQATARAAGSQPEVRVHHVYRRGHLRGLGVQWHLQAAAAAVRDCHRHRPWSDGAGRNERWGADQRGGRYGTPQHNPEAEPGGRSLEEGQQEAQEVREGTLRGASQATCIEAQRLPSPVHAAGPRARHDRCGGTEHREHGSIREGHYHSARNQRQDEAWTESLDSGPVMGIAARAACLQGRTGRSQVQAGLSRLYVAAVPSMRRSGHSHRKDKGYACKRCGYSGDADVNAAIKVLQALTSPAAASNRGRGRSAFGNRRSQP